VASTDIAAVAGPVLRVRILTNFRAEAEHVTVEDIIKRLLGTVPELKSGL
jgi:MoxR-like ATPase